MQNKICSRQRCLNSEVGHPPPQYNWAYMAVIWWINLFSGFELSISTTAGNYLLNLTKQSALNVCSCNKTVWNNKNTVHVSLLKWWGNDCALEPTLMLIYTDIHRYSNFKLQKRRNVLLRYFCYNTEVFHWPLSPDNDRDSIRVEWSFKGEEPQLRV